VSSKVTLFFLMIGHDVTKNLRIIYNSPSPFNLIISQSSISTYSRLFTFILTLIQAREALERIHQTRRWKDAKIISNNDSESCLMIQFLHVSNFFMSTFESYVFHTAINEPWGKCMLDLDGIARNSSLLDKIPRVVTVASVTKMHETCLDEICWRLFMQSQDQRIILGQIHHLFELIISFSRRMQGLVVHSSSLPSLFFSFQSSLKSFKELLKEVVEKEYFELDSSLDRSYSTFSLLSSSLSSGREF
jgi:hypothetical protein